MGMERVQKRIFLMAMPISPFRHKDIEVQNLEGFGSLVSSCTQSCTTCGDVAYSSRYWRDVEVRWKRAGGVLTLGRERSLALSKSS